jgi:hypothetical protein
MSDTQATFQVAAILAKAFLRHRKSRRSAMAESPQNGLDSTPEPTVHLSVVNDQRTDEN